MRLLEEIVKISGSFGLIFGFLLGAFISCAPSGFNGTTGVAKKDSAEAKPAGKPQVTPSPSLTPTTSTNPIPEDTIGQTPVVPSKCTDAGKTIAKLLTTGGITNDAPNQFLEYELSMEDCEGVTTPITASVILFDLDAEILDGPKTLSYQVKSQDGALLSSGALQSINGSDLFGVIGPNRFHHRTNSNINVPVSHRKVRLTIDLSFTNNQPMGSVMTGPVARAVIQTYLRFGDASPVKMPVTFITNGTGGILLRK
jgi:hypothetical protein